jgi:hypothetical protein
MSKKDVKIGGENDETLFHRRTACRDDRWRAAAMLILFLGQIPSQPRGLDLGAFFL